MKFEIAAHKYLQEVKDLFTFGSNETTPELSYRPILNRLFEEMASEFEQVRIIFEPSNQGQSGRPDWLFMNKRTLGVYGYVEAKWPSIKPLNVSEHDEQIGKYLELWGRLVFTDGIEFIFMEPWKEPKKVLLVEKKFLTSKLDINDINTELWTEFQSFFKRENAKILSEDLLVDLIARMARGLSNDIFDLVNREEDEWLELIETKSISSLRKLRFSLAETHDANVSDPKIFSDFIAQVIAFWLLYAHRQIKEFPQQPEERLSFLEDYWKIQSDRWENIGAFNELFRLLEDELASKLGKIWIWYNKILAILAYNKLCLAEGENPNFHTLYEKFLKSFSPETRFDFWAFYTPTELAKNATRLTLALAKEKYWDFMKSAPEVRLIDPCCGTWGFIEQAILQFPEDTKVVGFEILPAPYVLAKYRINKIWRQAEIVLTNTLSNALTEQFSNKIETDVFFLEEKRRANQLSSPPITFVIGNPPASDSKKPKETTEDFSTIHNLMEDFRPPKKERTGRQNTQKSLSNDFVRFLRWSCDRIEQSWTGCISLILPSAFFTHASYQHARKWLVTRYSDIHVLDIDSDHRGAQWGWTNVFNTLQGRGLLICFYEKKQILPEDKITANFKYFSLTDKSKSEKLGIFEDCLINQNSFSTYETDASKTYALVPSIVSEHSRAYTHFWEVYPSGDSDVAIFQRHCSWLKLATGSLFLHKNQGVLKRKINEILKLDPDIVHENWHTGQSKPVNKDKILLARHEIENALNNSAPQIRSYSFRPFLNIYAFINERVLKWMSKDKSSGTRYRPEVIEAFKDDLNFWIAVSPAPADLSSSKEGFRFSSFVSNLPDNDLTKRGNSQICCPFFPEYKPSKGSWDTTLRSNISESIIDSINTRPDEIAYYAYAVLSSKIFLNTFWTELHAFSWKSPRIPIIRNKEALVRISNYGKELADFENMECILGKIEAWLLKSDRLPFYQKIEATEEREFKFYKSNINCEAGTLELIWNDWEVQFKLEIEKEILNYSISGYNVLQQWLKFNSYPYTRSTFSRKDQFSLALVLDGIFNQLKTIDQIDDELRRLWIEGADFLKKLLPPISQN